MFEDPEENKKFHSDVIGRLANLEKHLLNLIFPMQEINRLFREPAQVKALTEALSKPILVDDRDFRRTSIEMKSLVASFESQLEKCNLSEFKQEIKFIGNRLNEIQERLDTIEEMLKLRAVKIYVDGKEMIPGDDTVYVPTKRKHKKTNRRR